MFEKKSKMNKEQLRDLILETVADALNSVADPKSLFRKDQGKIIVTKDRFGARSLSIERLQTDYNKEISCLYIRLDSKARHIRWLSDRINLLMDHLKVEIKTIDAIPSVPEHEIIITKKKKL